jgi:hypothetical protein
MSHSVGMQFSDLTLAVCSSGRGKRHDVIDIAEYPALVFVVSSADLELSARGPLWVDAVEKVGGFRLGWAFDAVGLMCGWATL